MKNRVAKKSFSLTEVLISVGILAVGLMFIAAMFPGAINLITVTTERTLAAIVADEAFAKIKLYAAGKPNSLTDQLQNFISAFPSVQIDPNEFAYPSTPPDSNSEKSYYWSALCRKTNDGLVEVTVFVSRKAGPFLRYPDPNHPDDLSFNVDFPTPVDVSLFPLLLSAGELQNTVPWTVQNTFFNPDTIVLHSQTGRIYRVIDRREKDNSVFITLRGDFTGMSGILRFWLVPPPIGGGRNPVVGVYQRVIKL